MTNDHVWRKILANAFKGLKLMMKFSFFFLILLFNFAAPKAFGRAITPGFWRFELKMSYAVVPFIIKFDYQKRKLRGQLINGEEVIELKKIIVKNKSLSIPLAHYEISLELKIDDKNIMSGNLVRHNKNPKIETPVRGIRSEKERFPQKKSPPLVYLNGKWSVIIEDDQETKTEAVTIFKQVGNKLHGSILTPTGDYRYLEGYVAGDEFEAASFDGIYNYLLKGRIKKDKLEALLLSNSRSIIDGYKNSNAQLADPYQATQLTDLTFSFPDLNGNKVSLNDPKFKDKPVIVLIYGSWCPNCLDEMNFMIPWYQNNQQKGVEVVALAFERSLSEKEAIIQLKKTQKKYKIPYTILLAGSTSLEKPNEKLPGLKNFISFPTTIFLDRKHQVYKIHAGFSGPSTGEFYQKWIEEFNSITSKLLEKK
jgi:thiol-disulfide isomerase/thioredoxin